MAALLLMFSLFGCAAHPTIADRTLKKGESFYGYTLSVENFFPMLFYRRGLSDISDIGFRIGLVPVYGTGVDFSRVLFEKKRKRDVLNIGWSLTPNSNFDFTYYKFSHGKVPGNARYWGLRGMFIPRGLNGGQSIRLGLLFGIYRRGRIGIEGGYFHDFASMPLTKVFTFKWNKDNPDWNERYAEFPLVSEGGIPTEHARITGLSLRFSVALSASKKKKIPKPEQ